ncbi:MAG: LysM peptidoglycan-binding domain-containing protein [Peptococcaceae bacterium]|jgi:nucleoid-associated protein YgaU|nr:LysM peptidoglycan-binding domain-containing protein [Peptococcaceae bacterium]
MLFGRHCNCVEPYHTPHTEFDFQTPTLDASLLDPNYAEANPYFNDSSFNMCGQDPREFGYVYPERCASHVIMYTVQAGDTLYCIARQYGLTWQALAEYNHLDNPRLIYPGQCLRIPVQY